MKGNDSAVGLVKSKTISIAVGFACIMFLSIVLNISFAGVWDAYSTMCFWYMVHVGELGMCFALLVTKLDQDAKKVAPAKESSASSASTNC